MNEQAEKGAVAVGRVAEALYLRVMDATADVWTEWAHLTDFKREPYVAEAREILAPLIALADHFEERGRCNGAAYFGADVATKIRAAIGVIS